MKVRSKSTVVFSRPFVIPGFDEVLPAGEYAFEAELEAPTGFSSPESCIASVLIYLHPKAKSPGLAQTLTIPFQELERALAEDKLSGQPLADFFLEEMLADPMVRLVMQSDGVSEADMRRLYSGSRERIPTSNQLGHDSRNDQDKRGAADRMAVETAENEGMPARHEGAVDLLST